MRATRSLPILLGLGLALAACTGSTSPSLSPLPDRSPPPDVSPQPSPEPSRSTADAELGLVVVPPEDPPEVRMAIPGQRVCFLVTVEGPADGAAPVTVQATADGATVERILPTELMPGVVGEVWVVPDPATTETTASITISASRDGATQAETRSLPIFPMADERGADAQPHFERWLAWLIAEHPELGITADTAWDPEFVSTLLVVSHYAYWSDDWEMTIAWHNMIAPYDWSEVHLRHRGTDVAPSLAFKVDSVSEGTEPYAIEPPGVVVR
jgi:hypothetical protein